MILVCLCSHDLDFIMASSAIKVQESKFFSITCGHIGEGSGFEEKFVLLSLTWKSLMLSLGPNMSFQEKCLQRLTIEYCLLYWLKLTKADCLFLLITWRMLLGFSLDNFFPLVVCLPPLLEGVCVRVCVGGGAWIQGRDKKKGIVNSGNMLLLIEEY